MSYPEAHAAKSPCPKHGPHNTRVCPVQPPLLGARCLRTGNRPSRSTARWLCRNQALFDCSEAMAWARRDALLPVPRQPNHAGQAVTERTHARK